MAGSSNVGQKRTPKPHFGLKPFPTKIDGRRSNLTYSTNDCIFVQDDPADAIFYLSKGTVKITVLSKQGKEAVVAILRDGDFFGEGCLTGQTVRVTTAVAMSECSIMKLKKALVLSVLNKEGSFSRLFVAHLLSRNTRIEDDLVDQLFNSSEKRLARVLLLLAHFGKEDQEESVIPNISQITLAGIVGTTRPRINFFMNRFRKLGFIDYNGSLKIHSSLLNVVLHD
jgi:CRP/FNR family transcriptional regulator, cyclic AMP receptor protein